MWRRALWAPVDARFSGYRDLGRSLRDTQRYLGSLWIGGGRCPWLGCALLQGNLCARTVGRYGACTSIRASSSHFCFPVARGLGRGTIGRYTWVGPRDTHRCRVSVVPHPRAAQVWDLKRVGRRETPSGKLCLLPSPFRAIPSVGKAYGWALFWRLGGAILRRLALCAELWSNGASHGRLSKAQRSTDSSSVSHGTTALHRAPGRTDGCMCIGR